MSLYGGEHKDNMFMFCCCTYWSIEVKNKLVSSSIPFQCDPYRAINVHNNWHHWQSLSFWLRSVWRESRTTKRIIHFVNSIIHFADGIFLLKSILMLTNNGYTKHNTQNSIQSYQRQTMAHCGSHWKKVR